MQLWNKSRFCGFSGKTRFPVWWKMKFHVILRVCAKYNFIILSGKHDSAVLAVKTNRVLAEKTQHCSFGEKTRLCGFGGKRNFAVLHKTWFCGFSRNYGLAGKLNYMFLVGIFNFTVLTEKIDLLFWWENSIL